ncbi:hypothetical protein Metfor_2753 [Methanoregula formicica SMSP]|uniref:Uncharacterized protein n=1 Tax=Methanoregula formicica (strain DSM 22288 / NBRC 105244 / SMSP) TaxID=593750 RepID=L0HK97_METFS|nr:hypothetical protein Metfor_2753 [Methanoregula formicica SMSP]
MKKTMPMRWIRKPCNRCGQLLLIHDDTVWKDNKTYHYHCWIKENESNSRKKTGIPGMRGSPGR